MNQYLYILGNKKFLQYSSRKFQYVSFLQVAPHSSAAIFLDPFFQDLSVCQQFRFFASAELFIWLLSEQRQMLGMQSVMPKTFPPDFLHWLSGIRLTDQAVHCCHLTRRQLYWHRGSVACYKSSHLSVLWSFCNAHSRMSARKKAIFYIFNTSLKNFANPFSTIFLSTARFFVP